jgi:hypothetical protein
MATEPDAQTAWEKSEMQRLMGALTLQLSAKDHYIGILEGDVKYYLGKLHDLEEIVKSIGNAEESTFKSLIDSTASDISPAEATLDKATDLIADLPNGRPVEDEDLAPLRRHVEALIDAATLVCCFVDFQREKIASFFEFRHQVLQKPEFERLLKETPEFLNPDRNGKGETQDGKQKKKRKEGQEDKEDTATGAATTKRLRGRDGLSKDGGASSATERGEE